MLREHFKGWQAAVLTGAEAGAQSLGLRSYRTHDLWNGALPCRLLRFDLADPGAPAREPGAARAVDPQLAASPGAQMFGNRISKNIRLLGKTARQQGVNNYRLYDADMPEYALAVDRYVESGSGTGIFMCRNMRHQIPSRLMLPVAVARGDGDIAGVAEVDVANIHLRVRRRQRGSNQYSRLGQVGNPVVVEEDGLKFLVNFTDYLDTGLFRPSADAPALAVAGRRTPISQPSTAIPRVHGIRRPP